MHDVWLAACTLTQGMPFGDSDDDLDLGDLNSDDSLYMPSPQHSHQPTNASKGMCVVCVDAIGLCKCICWHRFHCVYVCMQ
jgi:hypothetical protein